MTTIETNRDLILEPDHSIRTDEVADLARVKLPLEMPDLLGNRIKVADHRFPGEIAFKLDMQPEHVDGDPTPLDDKRPKVVGDLDSEDHNGDISSDFDDAWKKIDKYGQEFERAVMSYEVPDKPSSRLLSRLFDRIAPLKTFRRSTPHPTNASVLASKLRTQEMVATKLKTIPSQREF